MHQTIFVATGTIRLGQFLKLAGLVDTGGEAKLRVQNGEVRVNGAVDTRRGRQLAPGDLVEMAGIVVQVAEADEKTTE
ncbi:MAG: RNA-binding protein [Deltaproteobacteria bacterium CG_4_10_14_3_um_filter_60_8]|nr:MAG: RNA-binding protein [Desulfobacterales bacterium CG2_30_60_27]PIY21897.1 MAG: RNA-binding protein [Deltaproteobacteria bacterium CG_4_10_14_3_um_filter_60_8]